MARGLRSILVKSLAFVIPLIVCSILTNILMTKDPMRYFDGEYPWYRENGEYAEGHEDYCRVLIMGDSVSKSAWLPSELSEDTYNFAIGGASPIEEYYCLSEYLQNNDAPEYLLYSQMPSHFIDAECFWTRGVYFHRIGMPQVLDVYKTIKSITGEVGESFSIKRILDIPLYYSYSPIYYTSAVLKGTIAGREQTNRTAYQDVIENKGHMYFGSNNGQKICAFSIVDGEHFQCDALIDIYFRRIIELCEDHDIKFVYQSCPLSEITYSDIDNMIIREYNAYMEALKESYPNAEINAELFYYSDDLFNDDAHLSEAGATRFSREMCDKYAYIFCEESDA